MILTVVVAVFAAYAFARLRFRFKRTILVSVLATLLLPAYATLIPLYRIMASLGLVNTYIAVILVYVSGFLPLAIWILYNYFNSIPAELEEAAFVDGASPIGALFRVIIPVAMPGIAAAAIIVFLLGWAQFLFPLILTTDISTQPITVIVAALNQQRVVPFTLLMACGVIAAAIPGVLAWCSTATSSRALPLDRLNNATQPVTGRLAAPSGPGTWAGPGQGREPGPWPPQPAGPAQARPADPGRWQ
jgi:multiple sugar transport system permease protein